MFDRRVEMGCKIGQYEPLDIITFNDEEWIVVEIHYGVEYYAVCRPLIDYIITSNIIYIKGEKYPIGLSEYIEQIVNEYKRHNKR